LRLVAPASERVCAVLAFADVAAAIRASSTLRRRVSSVESLEMFLGEGLALVCSKFGIEKPFTTDHDAYLLVESADEVDPTDRLCEAIAATDGVVDAAFASEPSRRASLWRYREGHTEAINSLGAPHKLDVSLPIRNLAAFVDEVRQVVGAAAPAASTWLFGHVGDGNVHVNVTGVDPDDETVDDAVFRLAVRMGGNISAEHGIGVAKRRWLTLNRSQAEIATYRSIKRALDPAGILSPNVML